MENIFFDLTKQLLNIEEIVNINRYLLDQNIRLYIEISRNIQYIKISNRCFAVFSGSGKQTGFFSLFDKPDIFREKID